MKRSRVGNVVSLLACLMSVSACSESVAIRTQPPGASVYVDGKLVGIAPVVYTVPRAQFGEHPNLCRVEMEGYAPTEDKLRTQFAGGRLAGAIFTLGIVYLFKSPYTFRSPQDFMLSKYVTAPGQGGQGSTGTSVDRLERLQKLRDQGTITQQEFEQYKSEILRQTAPGAH